MLWMMKTIQLLNLLVLFSLLIYFYVTITLSKYLWHTTEPPKEFEENITREGKVLPLVKWKKKWRPNFKVSVFDIGGFCDECNETKDYRWWPWSGSRESFSVCLCSAKPKGRWLRFRVWKLFSKSSIFHKPAHDKFKQFRNQGRNGKPRPFERSVSTSS